MQVKYRESRRVNCLSLSPTPSLSRIAVLGQEASAEFEGCFGGPERWKCKQWVTCGEAVAAVSQNAAGCGSESRTADLSPFAEGKGQYWVQMIKRAGGQTGEQLAQAAAVR